MGEAIQLLIRCLLTALYSLCGFLFARNGLNKLISYYRAERRNYQIISGTIVDFEERHNHSRGHRVITFYPVFQYQWKGKAHRKLGRRIPAKFGKGLSVIPATHLQVGDTVQVRIFPKKPSDARIEESFYFFRSRTYVSVLSFLLGSLICLFGIYWLICCLIP